MVLAMCGGTVTLERQEVVQPLDTWHEARPREGMLAAGRIAGAMRMKRVPLRESSSFPRR